MNSCTADTTRTSPRIRALPQAGWGVAVVGILVIAGAASGQTLDPIVPPSSLEEAYGRTLRRPPRPRPQSLYQNNVQQQLLEAYQRGLRRIQASAGSMDWKGAGGVAGRGSYAAAPVDPLDLSSYSPAGYHVFGRYGGFGTRVATPIQKEGVRAVYARRSGLVAATGLNAPIYRALSRPGSGTPRQAAVTGVPFAPPGPGEDAVVPSQLDRNLREAADQAFQRARSEGWRWFHDARYLQAARAFGAARILDSSDAESRLGEVLCFFALGSTRSALVAVHELPRGVENPFAVELGLVERFKTPEEWRRFRLDTQLLASAAGANPDAAALRALLLWHLGERGEATVVVDSVLSEHPESPYATWASKMRTPDTVPGGRGGPPP